MIKIIKKLSLAVVIAGLFYSCSAQYHLKRAQTKDPSLFSEKIDTIYTPELQIDTQYIINHDTIAIVEYIDSLITSLPISDSCEEVVKTITEPLITYITQYKTITDTLTYLEEINNDSLKLFLKLKVWQNKDSIMFNASLQNGKIIKYCPEIKIKDGYFSKSMEILMLISIVFLMILLIIKIKQ